MQIATGVDGLHQQIVMMTSVDFLIERFFKCLRAYDRDCPFTRYGQLEYHVATIERRRALGSAQAALDDHDFKWSLYQTLQAWQIGQRASRLKSFSAFENALSARASEIGELDRFTIDQADLDVRAVGERLAELVQGLEIVENKARVVPGSKALHHVLPDLVVPIDRAYTQKFFEWPTSRFQYAPEGCFVEAFEAFVKIAQATNPKQYVGAGWYTSRTKVIDNAIVGLWCLVKAEAKKREEKKA